MSYTVPHYIDGKKLSQSDRRLKIYNPATGKDQGEVLVADQAMVAKAVSAAQKAYQMWSQTAPPHRAKMMFAYKALLEKNLEKLAQLITDEHGKTIAEAKGSIRRGIDVVDFLCGIPNLLKGDFAERVANNVDCYSLLQPLGVCAGITPFNFPGMIPLWMFPTAIACGNTFVLKPSEKDPACPLLLVELANEAGFPDGVVNLVNGDKETVDAILHHPDIKALSFVGSSNVAEYVYHTASAQNKRVQAFGGAKNHCIVMPDADLDECAAAIVPSAFGSAGERCMAISVVVAIGDETADKLIAKMKPLIQKIKIGAGRQDDTEMGPLINQAHLEKVQSYIKTGQQEGAKLIIDGSEFKLPTNGFYLGAYLFDHVTPTMKIYQDEIFGPVLCVMRIKDFETALQLINQHPYGNGTAIFTANGFIARQFAERVEVGMVGVNIPIPVPVAYQSFGGWKRSVFGDIGMYGLSGIRFYTKLKTVTQRWYASNKGACA